MKKQILVIVGNSGAGKDAVLKHLLANENYTKLITTTTRLKREGEIDGTHYHFISKEEFKDKLTKGDFLEHAEYNGHLYGTQFEALNKRFGVKIPAIILEPTGAKNLKEILEKKNWLVHTAFINESIETCIERVNSREENEEQKQKRIKEIKNGEYWGDYMNYDIKTKPLSSIIENATMIKDHINMKNKKLKNKYKI